MIENAQIGNHVGRERERERDGGGGGGGRRQAAGVIQKSDGVNIPLSFVPRQTFESTESIAMSSDD